MADYEYDVFVSYKRDPLFGGWLKEHFLPLFQSLVTQDIYARCKRRAKGIFFDEKALKPGDPWPSDLVDAICRSRCMVAMCSPLYFDSEWCLSELHSFLDRMESKKAKLLVPVALHDGDTFPESVRRIQHADFSSYVIDGPAFRTVPLYVNYQQDLKKLSSRVAELVHAAPPFETFPLVKKSPKVPEPHIPQALL